MPVCGCTNKNNIQTDLAKPKSGASGTGCRKSDKANP